MYRPGTGRSNTLALKRILWPSALLKRVVEAGNPIFGICHACTPIFNMKFSSCGMLRPILFSRKYCKVYFETFWMFARQRNHTYDPRPEILHSHLRWSSMVQKLLPGQGLLCGSQALECSHLHSVACSHGEVGWTNYLQCRSLLK